MNLLQKASIITTPTAYAEDYLYSIKPAITPLTENIIYTGFSSFTANSPWQVVNDIATTDGSSFANLSSPAGDVVVGDKYKAVFTITGGSVRFYFGTSANTAITVGAGTHTLIRRAEANRVTFRNLNSASSISDFTLTKLKNADFDFDRNSTGTRVNEDYLIEDVPYNLASYSENLSQWVNVRTTDSLSTISSPQNTTNVYKIIPTTDNATHRLDQVITLDDNNTYTLSFFAKKGEYNCIRAAIGKTSVSGNTVSFNLNTGVKTEAGTVAGSTMNLLPNGWYRCSLTTTASTADRVVIGIGNNDTYSFAGDASSGLYLWGIQLVKGDQPKDYLKTTDRLDIPRIDYTNGEPSILLEPSRTNSYQYSNDVTQSFWLNMGILIDTSNLYLSPEGINNAQKITANSGTYRLLRPQSGISGAGYAQSIFVKNINALNFYLRTASGYSYYNFETKTVNLAGSDNLTATHYPNDWVRLITTTPNASYKQFGFGQSETDSNDIGNSVYIYGAQLEAGSYATSLIHTSGSTVTRSADAANNAGNSDLINSTEGVLYVEFKTPEPQPTAQYIAINDGAAGTNQVRIGWLNFKIYIQIRAGGSAFYTLNPSTPTHTEFNKIAVKFKASDHAVYINGQEVGTSTASNIFSSDVLNTLSFSAYTTTGKFYGNVKSVMVFKEALTDLELEKLTGYNNHELYMNYYNRLSYLGLAEEYNVESDINNYIL